jgi:hypothetical protein
MTLVVARVNSGSVDIVSDTAIQDDRNLHPNPLKNAALKSIAISPSLCVCFANEVKFAQQAIGPLFSRGTPTRATVCPYLLEEHRACKGKTDFLIVSLTGSNVTIDHVGDHRLQEGRQFTYLGSQRAYDEFRRFLLARTRENPDSSPSGLMKDSMRHVIDDSRFPTVGGFVTHLRAGLAVDVPVFRYQSYLETYGHQEITNTTKPTSMLRSLGPEGGRYRMTVLVPEDLGIAAMGVHIVESRNGSLMLPSASWEPEIVRDVSCTEFIRKAREEHGLKLTGMTWV